MSKKYDIIVIDPPWQIGMLGKRRDRPNQKSNLYYETMSLYDIKNFNINDFCHNTSWIYLWVLNGKLNCGMPVIKAGFDILKKWNFEYHTIITWYKNTGFCPHHPYQIISEHCLFGYKKGSLKIKTNQKGKLKTAFYSPQTKLRSKKPDIFFEDLHRVYPEKSKISIFERKKRVGFDGFGKEYID